jgi:hypothetical protein
MDDMLLSVCGSLLSLQEPGTLQLLHRNFTTPEDIMYISVGRWHANNCEGIHPSYAEMMEAVAKYVQQVSRILLLLLLLLLLQPSFPWLLWLVVASSSRLLQ